MNNKEILQQMLRNKTASFLSYLFTFTIIVSLMFCLLLIISLFMFIFESNKGQAIDLMLISTFIFIYTMIIMMGILFYFHKKAIKCLVELDDKTAKKFLMYCNTLYKKKEYNISYFVRADILFLVLNAMKDIELEY